MRDCVYFAIESTNRYLKIGWSRDPAQRLTAMAPIAHQRFGSESVRLLGVIPGNRDLESQLHAQFIAYAIGNEWFHTAPELLNCIESQRKHFLAAFAGLAAFAAPEPQAQAMRHIQQLRKTRRGGRPRHRDRCPCGRYTRKYARQRYHSCTAPETLLTQPNGD